MPVPDVPVPNVPVPDVLVPPPHIAIPLPGHNLPAEEMDQLTDLLTQLVQGLALQNQNAVAAQAAQAAVVVPPVQPNGPRTATLTTIPIFTGAPHSVDLADWILSIDRAALADGWDNPMRRRVAIGKLGGHALGWHDSTGIDLATWQEWIAGLRLLFSPRLSMFDWCIRVENRRQLPGESGVEYVMDKSKICRLCPQAITEEEIIGYLIKGLNRPEQIAGLMAHPPATIAEFIETVRRMEQMGIAPLSLTPALPVATAVTSMTTPAATDLRDILAEMGKTISNSVVDSMRQWNMGYPRQPPSNVRYQAPAPTYASRPTTEWRGYSPQQQQTVSYDWRNPAQPPIRPQMAPPVRPPNPGTISYRAPGAAPVYTPRPRLPMSQIICHGCQNYGHFVRDCPNTITAAMYEQGNEQADPMGQGWPQNE